MLSENTQKSQLHLDLPWEKVIYFSLLLIIAKSNIKSLKFKREKPKNTKIINRYSSLKKK